MMAHVAVWACCQYEIGLGVGGCKTVGDDLCKRFVTTSLGLTSNGSSCGNFPNLNSSWSNVLDVRSLSGRCGVGPHMCMYIMIYRDPWIPSHSWLSTLVGWGWVWLCLLSLFLGGMVQWFNQQWISMDMVCELGFSSVFFSYDVSNPANWPSLHPHVPISPQSHGV